MIDARAYASFLIVKVKEQAKIQSLMEEAIKKEITQAMEKQNNKEAIEDDEDASVVIRKK